MATAAAKRIPSAVLTVDRQALTTLQTLKDYSPHNPIYAPAALQELASALSQAEEAELLARRAYEQAREQVIQAGATFHNAMLGAKVEVVAQYGDDSPSVHAVGRKQKSERRRPARRAPATA